MGAGLGWAGLLLAGLGLCELWFWLSRGGFWSVRRDGLGSWRAGLGRLWLMLGGVDAGSDWRWVGLMLGGAGAGWG